MEKKTSIQTYELEPVDDKKLMNEQGMQDSFYAQQMPQPALVSTEVDRPLVYDLKSILICLYFLSRSKSSMKIRYIA